MKLNPNIILVLSITFLGLHACITESSQNEATVENLNTEQSNIFKKEYSDSVYRYVEYDSAHYRITNKYFLNGDLFAIHKVDTIIKIDSILYFDFENNKIAQKGQRTHPHAINIGKWFSLKTKVPIIYANYDDSMNVNYLKAIKIANQHDFNFPDINISIVRTGNIEQWGIYRLSDTKTPQTILINCKTGEVEEYDWNLMNDAVKNVITSTNSHGMNN